MKSPGIRYLGLFTVIVMAINPDVVKYLGDSPFWNMFVAAVVAGSAYLMKSPIETVADRVADKVADKVEVSASKVLDKVNDIIVK